MNKTFALSEAGEEVEVYQYLGNGKEFYDYTRGQVWDVEYPELVMGDYFVAEFKDFYGVDQTIWTYYPAKEFHKKYTLI